MSDKKKDTQENIHSAVTSEDCYKMQARNNWKLKRVIRTQTKDLPYDCVFEGEQTSFEDEIYD